MENSRLSDRLGVRLSRPAILEDGCFGWVPASAWVEVTQTNQQTKFDTGMYTSAVRS